MSHSHAHPHAHDLGLLIGGVDLFAALIEAVDAAHHEVHLETYIFRFEGAGADVAHALMRAAQRGVQVRVVVDGVGTGELPAAWAARWAQAGVQVRVFAPAVGLGFWLPSRWRRLHRKLCLVDDTVAFCGGINILDDYFDPHVQGLLKAPRLDYAVSLRGPLVRGCGATVVAHASSAQCTAAKFPRGLQRLHGCRHALALDSRCTARTGRHMGGTCGLAVARQFAQSGAN